MAETAPRKLAAILAADVVGYSRLMGQDEDATVRTLSAYRATIGDAVVNHEGRVFGGAGDSLVAEFSSPVQAVRWRSKRALPQKTRIYPKIAECGSVSASIWAT